MENVSETLQKLKLEKEKRLKELKLARISRNLYPQSVIQPVQPVHINYDEKDSPNSVIRENNSRKASNTEVEPIERCDSKKLISLSVVRLPSVSIEPKLIDTSERQTQIESCDDIEIMCELNEYESESTYNDSKHENSNPQQMDNKDEIALKRKSYTHFEKSRILMSEKFQKFFDHSLKVTQRILYIQQNKNNSLLNSNNSLINSNYTQNDSNSEKYDENSDRILLNKCLFNSNLCKNRVITSFDFCSQYNELLLSTYYENESLSNDFEGLCLIWNLKYSNETPEYKFSYHSPVMTGCFAKFNPNLIIGGTFSGQIVIWDNRARRSTPVLNSLVSPTSHTNPIFCVEVIGSKNANYLVSLSNDGKMCSWDLNMLTKPINSIELVHETTSSSLALKVCQPLLATSMSFPFEDYNNPVIGCENGKIYSIEREEGKVRTLFEGHEEYVTKVDCHPKLESSHLFLTSSLDWTIKLWNLRETTPLYTFDDNKDSIYDIKWSPESSALFASVSGMSNIDIWDLNNDFHRPSATVSLDKELALNRITWTTSGKQVVAGDSNGKIWIYNVADSLMDNSIKLNDVIYEKFNDFDSEFHI